MSRYTFISSPKPLPEIDLRGFIRLKVKDLKNMNYSPDPSGPMSWATLDDEAEVLYAESEDDIGGLLVSICKNPPYGLDTYVKDKYVYWFTGNFSGKWTEQAISYLKTNVQKENNVKIWSLWFGYEFEQEEIIYKKLEIDAIKSSDILWLERYDRCC
ncbi:hypothetical protein AB4Z22_35130, partial [Paenibacillus sp. TAF58]